MIKVQVFKKIPLTKIKKGLSSTGKYSQRFINSVINGLRQSSFYQGKQSKIIS